MIACVSENWRWLAIISQSTFTLALIRPRSSNSLIRPQNVYVLQSWNYMVVKMIPDNGLDSSEILSINSTYILLNSFNNLHAVVRGKFSNTGSKTGPSGAFWANLKGGGGNGISPSCTVFRFQLQSVIWTFWVCTHLQKFSAYVWVLTPRAEDRQYQYHY